MSEDPDLKFYEVQQRPRKITDNKPVHVGIAILQYSKLHFLRFIYWLHEHLTPNSYYLCYADSDSIFLGILYYGISRVQYIKSGRVRQSALYNIR